MVGHPTAPPPVSGKAQSPQQWKIAAALAFAGALSPLPIPVSGLHKFYLRQPVWGGIYLLLGWTGIPRIACAVEGVWLLVRSQNDTPARDTVYESVAVSEQTQAIATALRELEKLRQEGLISEQEFEQNRRTLLTKLS
ncbi:hypothetical protein [Halomicronema sp. CCY15110]|uniref:hypothetical protein n=1 Tax=Halomicronema sp. CCY15110 TaxID=2767773 RepID=UPI001951EC14|nr:hypothetical protein [Halomicronema sp. CCY15110]